METENLDNLKYDIVIMLQPTSPFRKPEHITRTIEKLISGNFDSVWTVSECNTKYHPLKLLKLEEDGFEYFDPKGAAIIARQQLKNYYIRNGVCYAFTRNCILEMQNIKGARSGAVVINEELVNIDTKMDFLWAEFFINCQPK